MRDALINSVVNISAISTEIGDMRGLEMIDPDGSDVMGTVLEGSVMIVEDNATGEPLDCCQRAVIRLARAGTALPCPSSRSWHAVTASVSN